MIDAAPPKPPAKDQAGPGLRVLLVTGLSGAGKTSALKALEDIGYEAVDNVPLSLLPSLVSPVQKGFPNFEFQRPIAIGADFRTREFGVEPFLRELDRLMAVRDVDVKVVFLDCDDDVLRRRYAETRHRHPLALDRPVSDGIDRERRLLADLREKVDVVIDTTGVSPGALKRMLQGHFGLEAELGLSVFVTSFSFARGLPRAADLVFDVRFLSNPHYVPELRSRDGRDQSVADFVAADPGFAAFFDALYGLLMPLLPRYAAEGKSYLTIAVGCTGGRHRSVFIAEKLTESLRQNGRRVHVHHRDLAGGDVGAP